MNAHELLQRVWICGLLLYLGAALMVNPAGFVRSLRSLSVGVEEAMTRFRQQLEGTAWKDRMRWERKWRAWRNEAPVEQPSRWLRVLGALLAMCGLLLAVAA